MLAEHGLSTVAHLRTINLAIKTVITGLKACHVDAMLNCVRFAAQETTRRATLATHCFQGIAASLSHVHPARAQLRRPVDCREASSFSGIKTNDSAMEVDPGELPITPWVRNTWGECAHSLAF